MYTEENKISKEIQLEMYRTMVEIRSFEDRIYYMFLEGKMPGTIHLYQGQEAVAVGVCANLTREDYITSTHRPHGHAIAKGVSMKSMMAELFARTAGCCKGKGGSMHVGDMEVGSLPAIAIVAGGIPIATGMAFAIKYKKKDNVVACFFGDGATNEGAFHEAVNMGAIWNLPVLYVCENNFYGASTHVSKVMKIKHISERASAYGIPGETVDGNDILMVYQATAKALKRAKDGGGPTLLECLTYRRGGHSRRDANLYRDKQEEKEWFSRDPILLFRQKLIQEKILTEEKAKGISEGIEKEIDEAINYAKQSSEPKPEDTLKDVYA